MSGGFFRGTSADQDTRFSNKQAKLMKSQKFAPELEHLVDISKVKMDVVKPWIATRVTELLGFEDEVLINFIYGLLDGKDVNGKEVQIQITGFMEKNTGKFMKELWNLLLSAQKNASGVPQQFLDAKEEEIRIKKVESDRITSEIQKKKEIEQEKQKQMDEELKILKDEDVASHKVSKHSTAQSEDGKGYSDRNGYRGKNRTSRSPHRPKDSPSPNRINRSRSKSKSFSNSRSYSDDGHKSRSISRSPLSRGRSVSSDRRHRSPRKRSLSPYRKYSPRRPWSPLGRRSPISRRRSPFRSWRRSPSPRRRRSPSPRRRRSPLPRRRRSPSPRRRRSPSPRRRSPPSPMLRGSPSARRRRSPITVRHRSPSPVRDMSPSPVKDRSLSPVKDRSLSPVKDRPLSPVKHRRRSPIAVRRRSRTPIRYRSPYPPRRRPPSPGRRSPLRSPRRRRSPLHSRQKFRSGSPYRIPSPAYRRRRSSSSDRDVRTNGVGSRRYKEDYVSDRTLGKRSPQVSERELGHKRLDDASRQPPISLRSPQRDPRDRSGTGREMLVRLPSHELSPSQSGSSLQTGKSSPSEDRRASSRSVSPARNTKERIVLADTASPVRHTSHSTDSRRALKEEEAHYSRGQRIETPQRRIRDSPRVGGPRNISIKDSHLEDCSPERIADPQLQEPQQSKDDREIRRKDQDKKSEKASLSMERPLILETSTHVAKTVEYGPRGVEVKGSSPGNARDEHPSAKQRSSPSPRRIPKSYTGEDNVVDEGKHPRNVQDSDNEKNRPKSMERRQHKRRHIDSEEDSSDDSHVDERKEAKRRRKEEKRLRKEEKRRRREERHRKKEERRAGRLKSKTKDTVPFLDAEKNRNDDDDSDDQVPTKFDSHPSDTEEAESEQKKLEIELRTKALESLRAKKAINP